MCSASYTQLQSKKEKQELKSVTSSYLEDPDLVSVVVFVDGTVKSPGKSVAKDKRRNNATFPARSSLAGTGSLKSLPTLSH